MKQTIDVDTVLDILHAHQTDLSRRIDSEMPGSGSRRALWEEYKAISALAFDVRKASNDPGVD